MTDHSKPPVVGIIIDQSQALTLEEFCQALRAQEEIILAMIEHQLIFPVGETPENWRFDSTALRRARIAVSFYNELEINWPGVALALELLDQIEHLHYQLKILERIIPNQ